MALAVMSIGRMDNNLFQFRFDFLTSGERVGNSADRLLGILTQVKTVIYDARKTGTASAFVILRKGWEGW